MNNTDKMNTDRPLYIDFVGDSMIERWDLSDYFDSWITRNYGKSGAGIDYLEMLHDRFSHGQIVVMAGINDNDCFAKEERLSYAGRYLEAVVGLGADKVYLFSVLPCSFNRNSDVEAFNLVIKEKISTYDNIAYIDVYDQFICDGLIRRELYCDGLHLSPLGYQLLTNVLKCAVK